MYIISGKAKGMKFYMPSGNAIIRPTYVRARRAIFDSLGNIEGKVVVDLFAGVGSIGLEAASRGAKSVFLSEKSKLACNAISRNIKNILNRGVSCDIYLIRSDSLNFHSLCPDLGKKADIIFADPPYSSSDEVYNNLLINIEFSRWTNESLFILETSLEKSRKFNSVPLAYWSLLKVKKIGQSIFYFLKGKMR